MENNKQDPRSPENYPKPDILIFDAIESAEIPVLRRKKVKAEENLSVVPDNIEGTDKLPAQAFDVHSYIFIKNNTTIEEACSKKALSFYGSIKNDILKNELIADFTEMELAYFRNDTIEFSRRLHKQLEAIAGYCLFERIGLTQLKIDFLIKKGVDSQDVKQADGSIKKEYNEFILGEIIMGKQFYNLKNNNISQLTDTNIPSEKRISLFCYYYLNSNYKYGSLSFNSPAVYCYDYEIYNILNNFRKKGSHGWLRISDSTKTKLSGIESSPAKFYFDSFTLLNKFRFAYKVLKNYINL